MAALGCDGQTQRENNVSCSEQQQGMKINVVQMFPNNALNAPIC
jgi:hypothetical protein